VRTPDAGLRRPTDRARTRLRRIVLSAAVLVVLLAVPIGMLAHNWEQKRSATAAATLAPVAAQIVTPAQTADPALQSPPVDPVGAALTSSTTVRYVAPDGRVLTTVVPWAADDPAPITLWVDRSGTPGEPPSSPGVARNVGIALGMAWIVVALATLFLVFVTVRMRLDEVDSEQWDREWARVEPLWSGRIP
jgi:hypothetical protein